MAAAAGVVAAVCSGLANGSWNLPTKPDAPKSVYAGKVWAWENIWMVRAGRPGTHVARRARLPDTRPSRSRRVTPTQPDVRAPSPTVTQVANVMIPVFNTVFVLAVVGPRTLGAVYAAAEPAQMAAIIVPSIFWGFGGVGFGQSIKRLGVALGTSIVMGIIVVIGTALPAIMDAGDSPRRKPPAWRRRLPGRRRVRPRREGGHAPRRRLRRRENVRGEKIRR